MATRCLKAAYASGVSSLVLTSQSLEVQCSLSSPYPTFISNLGSFFLGYRGQILWVKAGS